MSMTQHYSAVALRQFAHKVLSAFGCEAEEAQTVADHLIDANLSGHDSHGIGMLPLYGLQVADGNLVPNQQPLLQDPMGAICQVDARKGFGHRMALLALDHAMQLIPDHRVAILGMRNSGHISRLGAYAEYCANRGFISMHMANVVGHAPIVAPFGARESAISTNPISMAIPVNNEAGPLLDMATSTVAFGKVRVASNQGQAAGPGWLIDERGLETLDPDPMAKERRGALSAFGAHKGSGLGLFVEILAGALVSHDTVASYPWLPSGVINNLFSIIIDPAGFGETTAIEASVTRFTQYIKEKRAAEGVSEVLLPGEPEKQARIRRHANGIPLDDETLRQIIETSASFSLAEAELIKILNSGRM